MIAQGIEEACLSAPRQKDLFGSPQFELFGEDEPAPPRTVFRIDPEDVREKLAEYVDELKSLETWPWRKELVDRLHSMTWPFLFDKLQNPEEAKGWKTLLEAEAARLDAATKWST
ncbi:MAG: hypothetical protein HY245_11635 [Rhizobiales bacterium]|nr:hypothetical protein [Hyphomicrobiales bacterium]MBI3674042.1 hypothetical protein [Hyphomicrobiales bacterium]